MATKSVHSPALKNHLRALAMVIGAGLLLWRTGAIWAFVLAIIAGALLILVIILPAAYASIGRWLDRLEVSTVRGFSWFVLAVLFATIFVPGRFVFRLQGRRWEGRREKRDTYWEHCGTSTARGSFDRQF